MGETLKHNEEPKSDDVFKREHLAEGFNPIMACVGTREQYGEDIEKLEDIEAIGHNAKYDAHPDLLDMRGFKNAGFGTYVISPIDEKPKFTKDLWNCTSIAAVGRGKETDKELSVLTHQDPSKFLKVEKNLFRSHLKERLEDLKERCLAGSIDIVITGGNLRKKEPEEYEESIEILSSYIEEIFGFKPLIICGPKEYNLDDVYLDAQNRRLYIVRPENAVLHNDVFLPDQIDGIKKKWQEENK